MKPTISHRKGACFLFGPFVDPEYGVCIYLRNAIGYYPSARSYDPRDLTLQEGHRFASSHTVWLFACLGSPYLVNGSDGTYCLACSTNMRSETFLKEKL
jgi:hypothetical protein